MNESTPKIWRQGDVFAIAVTALPSGRRETHELVLAKGETTGHMHRIRDAGRAAACTVGGRLFFEVNSPPVIARSVATWRSSTSTSSVQA